MAVTTKKTFPNAVGTNGQSSTVFSPVEVQLNNQDDLDVYVTLSGGTRVLQLRQSTGSTAVGSGVNKHPQVNDTTGLYFPAVSAGTTLYNYTLSTDNNTITFSTALPNGAVVSIERRTRDADSNYTTFASGSTIRATDLNNSSTESNFTAQEARNKAFTIEGALFRGNQASTNFVTTDHIVNGTIVENDLANSAITQNKLANNSVGTPELINGSVTSDKILNGTIVNADISSSAAIDASKIVSSTSSVAGTMSASDKAKLDGIQSGATDDQTASEIKTLLQSDKITNSEIATGTLDSRYFTETELTDGALDGRYFTQTASDARYFNISSGETIKDGDTFPDNDTTIATTAAINDRIIDLIDDVGGFDIIQSEQHFPNTNPQGVTGQAAVLSVKAASTNLVPSGTTVTISNGNLANNANITITGVTSTIPTGFGFLVESTSTTHTYAFHRLVPNATQVSTVAGKAVEIGRLGTADAVADMAILGTADVVSDLNTLGTADVVADMNMLATSDVISDMNTLAVTDVINDMDTVATNVANVNNVGTNIAKVNTVAAAIGGTQTFIVTVQNVGGSNYFFIDGQQAPVLTLARGFTYTFNVSDSSNNNHPLRFKDGSGNSYTTGVTVTGSNGYSGSTVVIAVAANAPSSLRYYCTAHGNGMGNTITVTDDNIGIVAGSITNVNEVGDDITNVNSVATSITNVNTVASNISNVNSFFSVYRIGANNPTSSLDTGDLFFNTTSNSLKVYTGSAWVDGVTATGNFAVVTGNTFTGSNVHNDNVKSIYGTGSDLQIYHDGSNSRIKNATGHVVIDTDSLDINNAADNETLAKFDHNGAVELYYDGSKKFESKSTGVQVTGDVDATGVLRAKDIALTDVSPAVNFIDSDDSRQYRVNSQSSKFNFTDVTNNIDRLVINSDGHIDIPGRIDATGGIAVTGNITVTGTVDGVDIAALNTTVGNISTEVVNDSSPQLGGNLDTNGKNIVFGDSSGSTVNRLTFGAGTDLSIRHTGTDTIFSNATGDLYINNAGANSDDIILSAKDDVLIKVQDGETALNCVGNGGVELFYDNVKKLETKAGGVQVHGNLMLDSDNDKAIFGAGNDLQIYHDGSNSYIAEGGTGDLIITSNAIRPRTDTFVVNNAANNQNMITAANGDAVTLFFGGSTKFVTTNSGINVTGQADVDSINCTGELDLVGNLDLNSDSHRIKLGAGDDFQIYHDGSNNYITTNNGDINITTTGDDISLTAADDIFLNPQGGEAGVKVFGNGAVDLFYDNVIKFQTTSTGTSAYGELNHHAGSYVNASGGYVKVKHDSGRLTLGAGDDLQIYHDGSSSYLDTAGSLQIHTTELYINNEANSERMIRGVQNAAAELYYDGVKKLETHSAGVKVSDGNLYVDRDNAKVVIGNNDDIQLYHNNGNNLIYAATNSALLIGTNNTHRWTFNNTGEFKPAANNTYDIGSTSARVRNIYTNDLHLSNEGSSNDVDQTWGDWTIQEGESDLFLKNNRSGKKYKFNLTEVS